jgi:hypothetical protein
MIPVHILTPYLFKVDFNIIFIFIQCVPVSTPFIFSNKNLACISYLSYAYYMIRPSNSPWIDL